MNAETVPYPIADACSGSRRVRRRAGLAAVAAGLGLFGLLSCAGRAEARFTCATNADCWETAHQCDCGPNPCNDGVCNPSHPDADAIGCILVPNDANCDDGNICNGEEFCDGKRGCQVGTPPSCSDDISCTEDVCDPEEGCQHLKRHSRCNNGQFCDGSERCDEEIGCVPGTPPDCNDGIACTADTCNEAADRCDHVDRDDRCDNGQFCDGAETCGPEGCEPGTPPNCNDGVGCTLDACSEANDACTHAPNNGLCSNGSFCDGVETCSPTLGCRPGSAPNCNDGLTCTSDSCDEANDRCNNAPNNAKCSNGLFCDGAEVCTPGKGCQPGTPPNCNDGVSCTIDRCIEANDSCDHWDNDDFCDDDKFCNGVETCDPLLDCQAGTPPSCDDSIACTEDICVESNNTCVHRENDAVCSNGIFCDGQEACDELLGCHIGPPPDCGDGVGCTIDTCNEETDSCDHEASDELCSNGEFCDGTETCDPEAGCQDGPVPDCDDGIDCTEDSCSDQFASCVNAPDNGFCDNELFCDGSEVCNPALGCTPGTPPNCNDNLACTDDSCAENADMCLNVPNNSLCGNGVVDAQCGEVCEPEDGVEICNNDIDDDGDLFVDCADPDCVTSQVIENCGEDCQLVPPCRPLARDPAVISWGGEQRSVGAPGAYSFHARLMPTTDVDPLTEGFLLTLSNDQGEIFRAWVDPAQMRWTRESFVYKAADPGKVAAEGGVLRVGLRRRLYAGEPGFGIRFKAYGDFSRATLPRMTTQVYVGNDVGYVTAVWGGEPGRWVLRPRDYEGGRP